MVDISPKLGNGIKEWSLSRQTCGFSPLSSMWPATHPISQSFELPSTWVGQPYNAINRLINSPNFPWLPLKPGPPTVEVISPLDPTLHAPKKLRRRSWCLTPELQRSACSNRIPLRQLAPVMLVWSCLAQICHWWDMNRGDCWSAREQMNSNNQQ